MVSSKTYILKYGGLRAVKRAVLLRDRFSLFDQVQICKLGHGNLFTEWHQEFLVLH